VPLLVMGTGVPAGKVKAAVTTTQIAPTILALLGMSPSLLQAVQLEGVAVLPGIPFSGNAGGNSGH
jgi:arylsulfatase A-like enzyme